MTGVWSEVDNTGFTDVFYHYGCRCFHTFCFPCYILCFLAVQCPARGECWGVGRTEITWMMTRDPHLALRPDSFPSFLFLSFLLLGSVSSIRLVRALLFFCVSVQKMNFL